MRKPILLVALAAAVVALPIVAAGVVRTVHGEGATDTYMTIDPSWRCANVTRGGVNPLPTAVNVAQTSHLLVTFTGEWAGLGQGAEGLLGFGIDDVRGGEFYRAFTPFEWGEAGHEGLHVTQSAMWTFKNVPAGDYTAMVSARVGGTGTKSAVLGNCAFAVSVMPAA